VCREAERSGAEQRVGLAAVPRARLERLMRRRRVCRGGAGESRAERRPSAVRLVGARCMAERVGRALGRGAGQWRRRDDHWRREPTPPHPSIEQSAGPRPGPRCTPCQGPPGPHPLWVDRVCHATPRTGAGGLRSAAFGAPNQAPAWLGSGGRSTVTWPFRGFVGRVGSRIGVRRVVLRGVPPCTTMAYPADPGPRLHARSANPNTRRRTSSAITTR
jgi:hypothetical protein